MGPLAATGRTLGLVATVTYVTKRSAGMRSVPWRSLVKGLKESRIRLNRVGTHD
jgi:hypothetical protein